MAVVLLMAAVLLLVLAAVIGPDQVSPVLRIAYTVIQWTGPVVLAALIGLSLRQRIKGGLRQILIDVTGPALIRAMSPGAVLSTLLPWIYGDRAGLQDVQTAILGGAGRDPAGRDTAVSRGTSAQFRLRAVDDSTFLNEVTWTHDYSGVRNNHKFIVFATSDPTIAGLIARERVLPLFELWLVPEDLLEDFVPNLRETTQVGISYTDSSGAEHTVPPTSLRGDEVPLRNYDQYIRLPEGVRRENVRIVDFDLYDLADADDVVESIETLSLRVIVRSSSELGYVTWSLPHPCFVQHVSFDVEQLAVDGQTLVFLVLSSTMKQAGLPLNQRWEKAVNGRIDVSVDSWMLPGHGVTLLWRPVDGSERPRDHQRW